MKFEWLALIIAAGAGVTMAVQGTLNTILGKATGLLEATFIVHLVGLMVAALLLIFGAGEERLYQQFSPPWYIYLGGVLGVMIIYGVVRSIPLVGVAPATTAIILGQVITAGIIDYLGLFGMEKLPFNWFKVAGTLLMAGGAWLLLKK
ncbi:MAG: DMT family transporter [Peptococcaceae bacterium]